MEEILRLINADRELSDTEILAVFDYIGKMADIILFKNDGLRSSGKFTVVIIHDGEAIRYDDATLDSALIKSLKAYVKLKE